MATKAKQEQLLKQAVPTDTPGARRLTRENKTRQKMKNTQIYINTHSAENLKTIYKPRKVWAQTICKIPKVNGQLAFGPLKGDRDEGSARKIPTCHAGKSW